MIILNHVTWGGGSTETQEAMDGLSLSEDLTLMLTLGWACIPYLYRVYHGWDPGLLPHARERIVWLIVGV